MAQFTRTRLRYLALITSCIGACGGSSVGDDKPGAGGTTQDGGTADGALDAFGGSAGTGTGGAGVGGTGNVGFGGTSCSCNVKQECFTQEELPQDPDGGLREAGSCPYVEEINAMYANPCGIQSSRSLIGPVDDECCYTVDFSGCGGGRPFVVDASFRVASLSPHAEWAAETNATLSAPLAATSADLGEPLNAAARLELARAWQHDALLEHASIASFARLTLQLLSLGAPPTLVTAAQQASLDEVLHAQDCFALASRYAQQPVGPGVLDMNGALRDSSSLLRLAVDTFLEGCVGETLAALFAEEQLRGATDPSVRAVLTRIARDEAKHAELAWRIVSWCVSQGGAPVREALRNASATQLQRSAGEPEPQLRTDQALARALQRHGRLQPSEQHAIQTRAMAEVIVPCLHALLALSLA